MSFSSSIPNRLQEHYAVMEFMSVMDGLQNVKTEIIAEAFRVYNYALISDRKWLLKLLSDFGVSDIPFDYPMQILQQYLLNADTVLRTRGSKIGIELYCSLLSFGEVSVDDSLFYVPSKFLLLDSPDQGYITGDTEARRCYLTEDSNVIDTNGPLLITIRSRYFNGDLQNEAKVIKGYLSRSIVKWLPFGHNKANRVLFTYLPREEFYFHNLLNSYFV